MARKTKTTAIAEDSQLRDYELIFIIKPELAEEAVEAVINGVSQLISVRKGVVGEIERWGKKKLAYPLKHNIEGYYVLAHFKMSPEGSKELKANLQISEDILRHLLINLEN